MLSNLLFVIGLCFLLDSIDRIEQNFNTIVVQSAASVRTRFHTALEVLPRKKDVNIDQSWPNSRTCNIYPYS